MADDILGDLEPIGDLPVSPTVGVSAIALNMALKWHDTILIKDGTLYQQKKMEGVNFRLIDFPDVLETARKIEAWLLTAPNRMAAMLVEGVCEELLANLDEADAADAAPDEQAHP